MFRFMKLHTINRAFFINALFNCMCQTTTYILSNNFSDFFMVRFRAIKYFIHDFFNFVKIYILNFMRIFFQKELANKAIIAKVIVYGLPKFPVVVNNIHPIS